MPQSLPMTKLRQLDYTTSYEISHTYKPKISENYENLHRKIPDNLLPPNALTRNDGFTTCSRKDYDVKFKFEVEEIIRKMPSHKPQFLKTFEEKILVTNYPRELTIGNGNTEYKRSYEGKPVKPSSEKINTPVELSICESRGLGRDEQTPIPPGVPSVIKQLEPYLSETQYKFAHYSPERQLDQIGGKNIITFYDANNFPRIRGFGPKEKTPIESVLTPKSLHIYDQIQFSHPVLNCIQKKYTRTVPRRGMQTEFEAQYRYPVNDVIAKTRQTPTFPAIPKPSPWETLSAPNMYCTENCHLGCHWPLLSTVNQGKALQLKT